VEDCRKNGGIAKAYIHDIAKKVDLQTMVNNLVDDQGRIDILINTANVNFPGNILDIDEWDLHRIFEVNAIGTLLTIQSVGRVMRAAGNGMIINCAQIKNDSTASYIASRSGLNNLRSALAEEFTAYGIKVVTTITNDPYNEIFSLFS
jgi:short-subunit dehydrogenase